MKNYYGLAQLLLSGHKIIFLIITVATILYNIRIDKEYLVIMFLCSIAIPFLYIIKYFYVFHLKKIVSMNFFDYINLYKYGLIFFCIDSLNLLYLNFEKIAIPILYNNEVLGIFSALSFFYITIFTMLGSAIGYVIFSEGAKNQKLNLNKIKVISLLIIVIFSIFFLLFGSDINNVFYGDKYNQWRTWSIDLNIILIAIFQFVNGLMNWIILAFSSKRVILLYSKIIFISLFIYVLILYLTINNQTINYQTLSFVIMINWFFKVCYTYYFIIKNKILYKIGGDVNVLKDVS